jgi:hypothetical protein
MDDNTKKTDNEPENNPEKDNDADNTQQDTQNDSTSDFMNNPEVLAYIELKVNEGIQKALKGKPPKSNTTDTTEQEKKNFDKMTYKERLNLFKTNPQAYYKLSKGDK